MSFADMPKQKQKEILEVVLKEILVANGLSYRKAAPKMAWSKTQFGHIVKGDRNLDFLDWFALCKVLEITPSDFLIKIDEQLTKDC